MPVRITKVDIDHVQNRADLRPKHRSSRSVAIMFPDLCIMLGLKLPTDPRWVAMVESNIAEILTDHAWCEQKAASNAITITVIYHDLTDLVTEMIRIAEEEIQHFGMVHEKIKERGYTLGPERKDNYVHDLLGFMRKNGSREERLVERLLFAAMIEARSCERFRMLSERVNDEDLRVFYRELMESEAEHYATFIGFARKYGKGVEVNTRWQEFLDFEAGLMDKYGKTPTIHG